MKVLIVDNDSCNMCSFKEHLINCCQDVFSVDFCTRLSDVNRLCQTNAYSIILLSLRLVDSQGIETFLCVRNYSKSSSIIVLVEENDTKIAKLCVEQGAFIFWIKGSDEGQLVSSVCRIVLAENNQSARTHSWVERFLADYNQPSFISNKKGDLIYSNSRAKELLRNKKLDLQSLFELIDSDLSLSSPIETVHKIKYYDLRVTRVRWKDEYALLFILRDIRHAEYYQSRNEYLRRIFYTLQSMGHLIAQERERDDLLRLACRQFIEYKGFVGSIVICGDVEELATEAIIYCARWNNNAIDVQTLNWENWPLSIRNFSSSDESQYFCDGKGCENLCPFHGENQSSSVLLTKMIHYGQCLGFVATMFPSGISPQKEECELVQGVASKLAFALRNISLSNDREDLALIVENTDDAYIWCSGDKLVRGLNDAACKLFKLERWSSIGKKIQDLLEQDVAVFFLDFIHRDRASLINEEIELFDKKNTHRYIQLSAYQINRTKENDRFFVLRASDITELRETQMRLVQSDRLASMGMLAAGLAHEINNPLSYVFYNLESLSIELPKLIQWVRRAYASLELNEEAHAEHRLVYPQIELFHELVNHAKEALDGVDRIRRITQNLSLFARVEKEEVSDVDIREVIECAINMAYNEIRYRARLVKIYHASPRILCSEGRLFQVILNLLINAAHAIEEGKVEDNEIRIETSAEENVICIAISDTGRGIKEEHLSSIFEPFFTTKGIGDGSGLGLAICRNIALELGGKIEVKSKEGKGTTFYLTLPYRVGSIFAKKEVNEVVLSQELTGRFLVVDDEEGILKIIKRILKKHELIFARSGKEAKEILLNDRRFDLVLCDIMMPELSGTHLHQWLKGECEALAKRFVFMTGGAFTQQANEYLQKSCMPVIKKPFRTKELISFMQKEFKKHGKLSF